MRSHPVYLWELCKFEQRFDFELICVTFGNVPISRKTNKTSAWHNSIAVLGKQTLSCLATCHRPLLGPPWWRWGGWDPVQQCLLLSWASHPGRARSPKICLWSDLFCETINCLEEQILTTIDFDQFWLKTIMIVALVFTKFLPPSSPRNLGWRLNVFGIFARARGALVAKSPYLPRGTLCKFEQGFNLELICVTIR